MPEKHSREEHRRGGEQEHRSKREQGRGDQAEAQRAHQEHGKGGEHKSKIDLNQADEQDLEQLTMMGPQRAKALVEHRPYKNWEDVEKVPGFSTGMIEDLKESGATIGAA